MRLKKLLVFLLVSCLTFEANAEFFGSLGKCISNPCNCFGGEHIEHWGDLEINRGEENKLCPPWNKAGGRTDHTCLVAPEQTYPGNFIAFKQNLCAEQSPESSYFEPKIRIRDQECNAIFCWTTENTLIWDGQCKTLAGPYGLPLTRMCARIALPEDPIRNMPADPGYTSKKHLDYKGELIEDKAILNFAGEKVDVDPPKLCAYLDPAFIGMGDKGLDIDLFDLNPNHQAFHRTHKLHPVIRILIFFIDMMASLMSSPADMMAALANMLGGGGDGGGFFQVIGTFFEGISWLIKGFFELIKKLLQAIGQINRVVSPHEFGCVEIPLAPFPPPFCEKYQPFFQPPLVQKICTTDENGKIEPSTLQSKCVHSRLRNNAIHNSVRVGYEYLIPLCRNGENPEETDMCVTIENLDYNAADMMHTIITGNQGILKLCSETSGSAPCIKTSTCGPDGFDRENPCIPYECSIKDNGCNQGIRLVYGIRNKDHISPIAHYRDDLDSCTNGVNVMCQEVWGVNMSEFVDVDLSFSTVSSSSDLSNIIPLVHTFSLKDNNGKVNTYNATITKENTYKQDIQYTQSPKDICVYEGQKLAGCVKRGELPKPEVHKCSDGYAGISCDSDTLKPQMIVSASIGSDSVATVAIPKTVYDDDYNKDEPSFEDDVVVNLAGYGFSVFVTDDEDTKKPFSGERAINPSSVHGLYKGNANPVDDQGKENGDAIYLKGLEYVNGRYYRGGTEICIQELEHERCPIDTTQCVLTKITNSDQVDCEVFSQKSQSYPGIAVCPDELGKEWVNIPQTIDGISLKKAEVEIGAGDTKYTLTKYCYESDKILCTVSHLPEDRIVPGPTDNKVMLDEDNYYNVNFTPSVVEYVNDNEVRANVSGLNYDKKTQSLRDKTSYEKGLCVEMEKVYCDEREDNNATWPRTVYGEEATGTCKAGFTQKSQPLKRYCLPNEDFKGAHFEDLDGEVGCQSN